MTITEIKALWRTLPLAVGNDLGRLDEQVEKNPGAWEAVAHFLHDGDLATLPLGRNEIGEGAFANVQEYETKLTSKYELHRRYIDVQLLTHGEELVYVAPMDDAFDVQGDFDVEADYVLYASARNARRVRVAPDSYLLLYPGEAHMPCMALGDEPMTVRKIVVKIPFA